LQHTAVSACLLSKFVDGVLGQGMSRAEVEAAFNLPALVHELRRRRMGMVQTLEQVCAASAFFALS
jgi:hypothetical protein